jgi:hypothetical protein
MAYRGSFLPKYRQKYSGDINKITYRSLWELRVMQWLDFNPDVVQWNSEETIIPYRCKTDGKMHRYFMDFTVQFNTGVVLLVEVKPKTQTEPPKNTQRKKPHKFLTETMTFAKNTSKWYAAKKYAQDRSWEFQIWTEDSLKSIGINVTGKKPPSKQR